SGVLCGAASEASKRLARAASAAMRVPRAIARCLRAPRNMPRFPAAASLVAALSSLRVNISHNWADEAQDAQQKRWFARKDVPWCFSATPLKNRGKRAAKEGGGIEDRPLTSPATQR